MMKGFDVLFWAVCVLQILAVEESAATQCLSNSGEPVDWFIIYKTPENVHPLPDNSFFYMDAQESSWQRQQKTIDEKGHAVYYTLNQIYSQQSCKERFCVRQDDFLYLMYNDQMKNSKDDRLTSGSHGHTKGVIAFDSYSGFWLVHSTPEFPPPRDSGYSWPETGRNYGQTFLCVSMDTKENLDNIGTQLLYNYPYIYDSDSSEYFDRKFPNMAAAMNKKHVTEGPWNSEVELTSLAGTKFHSFAKYSNFEKDLYADWLAPRFRDTLCVETWQSGAGGRLCNNCTAKYPVYNIASIAFSSPDVVFKETKDHAKWAATKSEHWTCIGDINRMESQEKRAGGTVCFKDSGVWNSFRGIINSTRPCGPC